MKKLSKIIAIFVFALTISSIGSAQTDIEITHAGHIYSTLSEDCIGWPSTEIYNKARSSEWGKTGYYPANGDKGIIIGEYEHCSGNSIYIVKIDNKYYVPIKAEGINEISNNQSDYSQKIEITHVGHIYSTLPEKCLNWPSTEIYNKARKTEWSKYNYYPSNGDIGVIIGEYYQDCGGHTIYIVKIDNKHYVPIKKEGVTKIKESNFASKGRESNNSQKIEITHAGHIYSTLSEDCLNWPSTQISNKARKSEWEKYGYYPSNGDKGVIIGEFEHCSGHTIYIVKINNKYYVPIKTEGVTEINGNSNYSQKIEITHAGHIYSTLPEDCLNWPSIEINNKARSSEWQKYGYYPKNGDKGVIVGEFEHCGGHMIYIIKIDNKYYVPIKKEGVTKY